MDIARYIGVVWEEETGSACSTATESTTLENRSLFLLGVPLVVLLGESQVLEELGVNPLQGSVTLFFRLFDAIAVGLGVVIVTGVVL